MYDTIVIGARCAGSSTAMLLAHKGYRVLLLDRDAFPSDHLSTHWIHQRGVRSTRAVGLARATHRHRLPADSLDHYGSRPVCPAGNTTTRR